MFFKRRDRGDNTPDETETILTEEADLPEVKTEGPASGSGPSGQSASTDLSSEEALLDMVNKLISPGPARKDTSAQADAYLESDRSEPAEIPPLQEASEEPSQGEPLQRPPLIEPLAPLPEDEELISLRRLILSREIDGLENLHGQMADRERQAGLLSQVITEAIRLRVRRDDELIGVLKPTVDNIVRTSVRNNPNELADNLFPVIGPAIRRSISESIKGMLQDFSRTLEKSFSLTGVKWRIEAARAGKPFSEVVLLKTLEYQVEQVFVIHADSGVPLIHLVNQEAFEQVKDPDQVAAMLTAIQHFVNDSFAQGELDTLEFGDRKIFVTRAPQVYLACVVRGQPPSNLRIDMQTALELLVMECAEELDVFSGDVSIFNKAQRHFEALLISRFKDENKKLSLKAKMPLIIILAAICGTLIFLGYKKYDTERLEERVLATLDQPGLMPLRVTPKLFGQWDIICLKDESISPQDQALIEAGLPADRFKITYQPYVSHDPEIVYQKLAPILTDLPEGMTVYFDRSKNILYLSGSVPITWILSTYERLMRVPGLAKVDLGGLKDNDNGVTAWQDERGVMHFDGQATMDWIENVRERVLRLPGVSGADLSHLTIDLSGLEGPANRGVRAWLDERGIVHFEGEASVGWMEMVRDRMLRFPSVSGVDLSQVKDDPATRRIKQLVELINETVILFPLGKDQPVSEERAKLELAADRLTELEKLAESMDLAVNLIIYGHADATGSQKTNYSLSQERTKTLAALLYARGCTIPLSLYGMGDDFAAGKDDPRRTSEQDQNSRKIEMKVQIYRKGSSLLQD